MAPKRGKKKRLTSDELFEIMLKTTRTNVNTETLNGHSSKRKREEGEYPNYDKKLQNCRVLLKDCSTFSKNEITNKCKEISTLNAEKMGVRKVYYKRNYYVYAPKDANLKCLSLKLKNCSDALSALKSTKLRNNKNNKRKNSTKVAINNRKKKRMDPELVDSTTLKNNESPPNLIHPSASNEMKKSAELPKKNIVVDLQTCVTTNVPSSDPNKVVGIQNDRKDASHVGSSMLNETNKTAELLFITPNAMTIAMTQVMTQVPIAMTQVPIAMTQVKRSDSILTDPIFFSKTDTFTSLNQSNEISAMPKNQSSNVSVSLSNSQIKSKSKTDLSSVPSLNKDTTEQKIRKYVQPVDSSSLNKNESSINFINQPSCSHEVNKYSDCIISASIASSLLHEESTMQENRKDDTHDHSNTLNESESSANLINQSPTLNKTNKPVELYSATPTRTEKKRTNLTKNEQVKSDVIDMDSIPSSSTKSLLDLKRKNKNTATKMEKKSKLSATVHISNTTKQGETSFNLITLNQTKKTTHSYDENLPLCLSTKLYPPNKDIIKQKTMNDPIVQSNNFIGNESFPLLNQTPAHQTVINHINLEENISVQCQYDLSVFGYLSNKKTTNHTLNPLEFFKTYFTEIKDPIPQHAHVITIENDIPERDEIDYFLHVQFYHVPSRFKSTDPPKTAHSIKKHTLNIETPQDLIPELSTVQNYPIELVKCNEASIRKPCFQPIEPD